MSQDYIALEWVKGEIKETLLQAQQSLEAYVEHPQDRSRLRFCLSYLHQVHGTLQMVEFYGAALLAEEMEAVALALTEGQLASEQDGLEVLMQAIIQLPHYLEHVKVGRRDLPVVLLPILNELRSTRGENFLSETSLFTPHIEHNTPLSGIQKNQFTQANFSQWLRKTRQMLQAATLQLLQDKEPELAKHYINKLFARLNKTMGGTPQGIIWLPALAFSEWLMKQDALPKSAKVLLRQLDQLLKQDLDKGVAVINRPPADQLLKNLLFYVARTEARGEAIRLVQKRFRLAEALPSAEDVDVDSSAMSAGSDAIGSALTALIEEISTVKDDLDQIVRGSQEREPALESARLTLRQIADTMGMLGLGMPRKVMQEQESTLVSMIESGQADDSDLLDVAGALLYVEATLNGMLRDGDMSRNATDSAMSDAQHAVLREARNVLEQVKDSVVAYMAHQWSTDKLEGVPEMLHSIEGSLNMVPLPRVAHLLADLSSFIHQALLSDRPAPEWGVMDMVAEVLSGIEYYLERYSDQARNTDTALLERVEETLAKLMQLCSIATDSDSGMNDDLPEELQGEFGDKSVAITSFTDALGLSSEVDDAELPELEVNEEDSSNTLASAHVDSVIEVDEDDDLIDDEIIEVFLEEADEVIETLNEYWPKYNADHSDMDALTTVRRSYHTLKGSGRMVRAGDVSELAWAVENMFNRVLDNTIDVSPELVTFVDLINEQLPGLVEDFRQQRAASIAVKPLEEYAFALADGNTPETLPSLELNAADDSLHVVTVEEVDAPESTEREQNVELDQGVELEQDSEALNAVFENTDFDASDVAGLELNELIADSIQVEGVNEHHEDDDDRLALLDIFIAEAESHLSVVDGFVEESRGGSYTNQISDDVQRALHTLKGSAHMAAITPLADVASPLEKLVKELRGYQQPNSPELVELLEHSAAVLRGYLTSDQLQSLTEISEADALLERIQGIEQSQLAHLHHSEAPVGATPEAINTFLASGMDSLLLADELLQKWRDEDRVEVLDALTSDLAGVSEAAARVELEPVQQMADALHDFYAAARRVSAHPEEKLVAFASEAHEELLNLMDYLAAGQDLPDVTETVNSIRQWNFEQATNEAPATQDEEDQITLADVPTEIVASDSSESSEGETESNTVSNSTDTSWMPSDEASQLEQADIEEQEDDMILDIFLEEAEEISEAIESILQKWESSPDDLLPVAELQRELHTMKGGARMAELPEVADLCHEIETLYERLNDGVVERDAMTMPLLQRSHDHLASQLQSVRTGNAPADADLLIEELKAAAKIPLTHSLEEQDTAAESRVTPIQSESADESDREIVTIFLDEAAELMENLDEAIISWRTDTASRVSPDEILRVLHTLKGGARLAGLSRIGDTTHNFESDILKAISREGNTRYDDAFFGHLNQRQETLQSLIDEAENLLSSEGVLVLGEKELVVDAREPESTAADDLDSDTRLDTPNDEITSLDQSAVEGDTQESQTSVAMLNTSNNVAERKAQTSVASTSASTSASTQSRKAPTELVKVSADLLDSLVNLAGETAIGRGRLEEQVSDFSHTLGDMDQTIDRLRDQLRRLDLETEAQVLFRQDRQGPSYEEFDPLEMDRYSAIQQLSRALVESASDLQDLKETLAQKTRDAETLLLQQSRVNSELQEGLMKTRMVPFQRLVPRLRRIVRQVSLELNKQVDLRVNNADGEMDRTILERMISPLEHMVRNAVDHGIENTEGRVAADKSATGNIELDIRRDGGDVVLTLRDDGRGINLDAVLKKARERDLIAEDAQPSDYEIMQCILQPGFSTAEVITQISGRGVGMDVVSSEIKQMGGTVEIRSERGVGTEFEVRLPFTVSVNRALMVRIGEDLYAVPLNNIQGIVRASVPELQRLYDQPESERLFNYAGRDYQLGYLGAMLDDDSNPKITGQHMPLPLLLVRGQVPFALQVDSLLGSREIVVKSLGPQFAGVRGISGGTILGDGSVVVILDLPAMIRTHTSLEYQQARALDHQAAVARHEQEKRLPKVMVVDDSVTVRKVTTRLLERHGMEVLTAKDGMHAMEVLQDHKPDVMLLDIEMPRMDGFEVASLVRHDERLKDVPIIMITSRTGDKHRERAMSIGVNAYMGKPFQEDALLENINHYLGQEVD